MGRLHIISFLFTMCWAQILSNLHQTFQGTWSESSVLLHGAASGPGEAPGKAQKEHQRVLILYHSNNAMESAKFVDSYLGQSAILDTDDVHRSLLHVCCHIIQKNTKEQYLFLSQKTIKK